MLKMPEKLMTHPLHDAKYPIHNLFRRRWSPRAFAARPVEPEKLRILFEAARWAASCFNEQPWRFIIATKENPAEYEKMLGCLVEKNQKWAKSAPVLMISVAELNFAHNGKPNRHALHDTGAAAAFMALQATDLGFYIHQMAGFSVEKAREVYAIPPTAEPVAAIAVGYLGDPETMPEEFRAAELAAGKRRPISESVYSGTWGQRAEVVKE
jgi:nitroreductase